MMDILFDYSLKHLNTFGFDVKARQYFQYSSTVELKQIIESGKINNLPVLILGGGSNLLFTKDYDGIVLHSGILGIDVIEESSDEVVVCAGAGVIWDDLVRWAVEKGFYGLENLSIIPGSVGASPVQNIGAYGVELKDVFEKVQGVYIIDGSEFELSASECEFDYRYSIFKSSLKNATIITNVIFRLSKKPVYSLEYGALAQEVNNLGDITLENVRQAVINIRQSKLPDPEELGNAGSFFKNPVISYSSFKILQKRFPDIPHYVVQENEIVKIPAGWLIEQCGWKGRSMGRAAVHSKQALVLVNLGNATGDEVVKLAECIENDVFNTFNIKLEREVNVID